MHKKLATELVSLAHSILQMENMDDISALHTKSLEIFEKLTVLKMLEEKPEFFSEIKQADAEKKAIEKEGISEALKVDEENVTETNKVEDVEKSKSLTEEKQVQFSLEDELEDAISADTAANLFEKVTNNQPNIDADLESNKRSLNDALFASNLQVGLNDRIAFVKNLFDGSQEEFNRVLSQLNSFDTELEAKQFIGNIVKPDYDWSNKQEYEERLLALIERKFL